MYPAVYVVHEVIMKTEISHPVAGVTVTGWLSGRLPQPDITLEPNAQYRPPHEISAPALCQGINLAPLAHLVAA